MIVLGIDTATVACSVAIGSEQAVLAEEISTVAETHSRHLMDMVLSVCRSARIDWPQIDGFAVTSGPGSFTGLRIGISTVKGLCFALDKPLAAVSTLELLATQAIDCREAYSGNILSLINARRKEVYAGWYHKDEKSLKPLGSVQVASIGCVLEGFSQTFLVVGDGSLVYRELIESIMGQKVIWADASAHVIQASTLVRLGLSRFAEGRAVDASVFSPEYVRKPDIHLPVGGLPGGA